MEPFKTLSSRVVAIAVDNIDTDQIIPARYLKTTDKAGLGQGLFADWRYDGEGRPRPEFVLNRPGAQGAQVLLAGDNFGCGSSREHAPWALLDFGIRCVIATSFADIFFNNCFGFRAVISTSFADIFRANALKNGLLPIVVDGDTHRRLLEMASPGPEAGIEVTINLAGQTLRLPDGTEVTFPIDGFARKCLLQGVDELGYLLSYLPQIAAYEARQTWQVSTNRA